MSHNPPPIPIADGEALCRVVRLFGERQWCLATSGNFSLRTGTGHCLITQSGRDKSALGVDDLMLCDLDGKALDAALTPSAETPLHAALYRYDAAIGAVLHTHSVAATVLSRAVGGEIEVDGFEMQKAMSGIPTHHGPLTIPVFANSQDMAGLAVAVIGRLADSRSTPGFLLRGHGLYAWGRDLAEAQRHAEGLEFVIACAWQEQLAAR